MKKVLLLAPMGSIHRRFNRANIEALLQLQYDITLMANFEDGEGAESQNTEFVEWCKIKGIEIKSIGFSRGSFFKNVGFIPEVKRFLKDNRFDIVHAHTETGGLILSLSQQAKGKSKFVYTAHGLSFYDGGPLIGHIVYKPIERWICSRMDVNLAMNSEELKLFSKWNSNKASFFHGIGIDLSRFIGIRDHKTEIRRAIGIPDDAILLMSIGELDDNKNHTSVIQALGSKGVDMSKVYYIICGVGALMSSLEELTVSLGIDGHVKLLGYRKDIPELVGASDLFVFPSKHEGLPVSLMEAMAGGLPVACSRIRGCVDLIHEGVNGYLFNPNDVDEISQKLNILLKNRDKWSAFAENNLRDVKLYSHDVVVEEMKKVYQ